MDESPEKIALRTLTLCTVKALSKFYKLLNEAADKKRDKKIERAAKELEICNDEAMRNGLGLSAQQIGGLKMGRGGGSRSPRSNNSEPRLQTPFSQLMEHHAKHFVGGITDGGAQGKAIKWILERFTPELAIQRYNQQVQDSQGRYRVSWLTVQKDIGRIQNNGNRPTDAAGRDADRLARNLFAQDVCGDSETDYH